MLATAPHPQNAHSALSPAEVIAAAANALIEISCSPAPSSLKIGQVSHSGGEGKKSDEPT